MEKQPLNRIKVMLAERMPTNKKAAMATISPTRHLTASSSSHEPMYPSNPIPTSTSTNISRTSSVSPCQKTTPPPRKCC